MKDNGDPIIRLEAVHKAFGSERVLRGLDLSIRRGQTTVVIGASGCGKSVLLKHIIGLLRPDSGKVFFEDQEVSAMSERALGGVRRRMGFLFQGSALFDSMTVEENICFAMAEHNEGDRAERERRCAKVLAMVGMDGLQMRYPQDLSGGQKKRVGLARAIVLNPQVILYDEPTTGLDPIRADLINELILRMHKVLGVTSVVVTHDLTSAKKVADRILMMHEGRFIVDTPPDRIDQVPDEVFARFIRGQADRQEMAKLEAGRPATDNDAPHTQHPTDETAGRDQP